jgi:hypothetical protein
MRIQVDQIRSGYAVVACMAWLSVPWMASCSSGNKAPAGGRLEHPPQRASMPVSSAKGAQEKGLPTPEAFSPLDKAIADFCRTSPSHSETWPQAWSQNVPDRDCANDGECGDGFCDRGHCASIWSCDERYGQRCIDGRTAPGRYPDLDWCRGLCLAGRCRSCESDAECMKSIGRPEAQCVQSRLGRICTLVGVAVDEDRTIP